MAKQDWLARLRVVAEEFLICELLGIYSQEGMKGLTEFHAFKDRSFDSLSRILLFPPPELVEYASRRRKASYDIRLWPKILNESASALRNQTILCWGG